MSAHPQEYAPDGLPRSNHVVLGRKVVVVDHGSGEPVVFVHGNPSWSYSFRHQIDALAKRYRVVAPDLLGFGGSEGPAGGATFIDQADMLERLLEELDLGPVHLVLHDWGGPVGLRWAARNAECVKRLVLINTTASPEFRPPLYWRPFTAPLLGDLLVRRLNLFVIGLPLALRAAQDREVWAHYRRAFQGPASREAILKFERQDGFRKVLEEVDGKLSNLRMPCLIIWGEPDFYFRRKDRRDLLNRFPQARLFPVAGGGHFPFEDRPEEVTRTLEEFFLESKGARGSSAETEHVRP